MLRDDIIINVVLPWMIALKHSSNLSVLEVDIIHTFSCMNHEVLASRTSDTLTEIEGKIKWSVDELYLLFFWL